MDAGTSVLSITPARSPLAVPGIPDTPWRFRYTPVSMVGSLASPSRAHRSRLEERQFLYHTPAPLRPLPPQREEEDDRKGRGGESPVDSASSMTACGLPKWQA